MEDVRRGRPRVLVLRGEAGIGKSALLESALHDATWCRVERTAGVESEMELPFAGLHQLCAPLLDYLPQVPAPRREAISVVFGLAPGGAPDRFRVGVAVLSLLAEASRTKPVVCVIDDAHWLDAASAQVLGFVARRLTDERVGLLFAERTETEKVEFTGLPELRLTGLSPLDARGLLEAVAPGILDERMRDRIVAETRGNPLALIELPRSLTSADYADGPGATSSRPLAGRIEDTFRRRLDALPAGPRLLAIAAAAEPVGDPVLLWRAAQLLGLDPEALVPAEQARLLSVDTRVEFRHPLARSAVYRAASVEDRRRVHSALAKATDPDVDPDRRAWHRAQASFGPDEQVAAELEQSAGRAQRRGGLAAAAAFLARATALTPDAGTRARRAVDAAAVSIEVADFTRAQQLLATADLGRLDLVYRAKVERLRAATALVRPTSDDAIPALLESAGHLEPLDPAAARATYFEALRALISAGRLAEPARRKLVAERTRAAPAGDHAPTASDLFAEALATRMLDGYSASVAPLRKALRAVLEGDAAELVQLTWLSPRAAIEVWDDRTWEELSVAEVRASQESGALGSLAVALSARATVLVFQGRLDEAQGAADEAVDVMSAIGNPFPPYALIDVDVFRGNDADALAATDLARQFVAGRPNGAATTMLEHSLALLHNSRGDYCRALRAIESDDFIDDIGLQALVLPEYVEAAARDGELARARWAAGVLSTRAYASGSDWALGVAARSNALLLTGTAADASYREAIDRLGRTTLTIELARARLVYGEWLRRDRRRRDAREHLELAHEAFADAGAEGFAARAARELQATGARVRRRTAENNDELTSQELQVARLARDGLSNPEIGAQLFISPRTVQYHLGKVFAKLAITSRTELHGALPDTTGDPAGVLADAN